MTDRLGIVYTPVQVVDFINRSVNHILAREFGETLGSKNVHILDPFTGTGTFITRLMQSGLISPEQLKHKYRHEIHANEIVLLAYYIAAINIEATYHDIVGGDYTPFEGILLTDTFQMYEKDDLVDALLVDNSARRKRQKALDIRVIVGNPPYSVGQSSENEINKNIDYDALDGRIRDTYVKLSSQPIGKKSTYDSYLRAIRWASDRIGNAGVIGYVSGSSFVEKFAMDGVRRSIVNEFSSIYVLNSRGDIRKNILSKGAAGEGQNIFGSDSMTGIAITIFIKSPRKTGEANIFYHDIGNSLTRDEKLGLISGFGSINGVAEWSEVTPDEHGDWLRQRDVSFSQFIALSDKLESDNVKVFEGQSFGANSARDAWYYNPSRNQLVQNMSDMISFYNNEVERYTKANSSLKKYARPDIDKFINVDATKISWGVNLKNGVEKGRPRNFDPERIVVSIYRPFTKRWFYADKNFNHSLYKLSRLFPTAQTENKFICVSGVGARSGFSVLISNTLPNYDTLEKGVFFLLSIWSESLSSRDMDESDVQMGLDISNASGVGIEMRDGLTEEGLVHFQQAYPNESITKEDLFYYVYGLLHSPDYRERYADNLSKELPRIPSVKTAADFRAYSQAGRDLAELHLNYESVPMYAGAKIDTGGKTLADTDYRVEKMKFSKKGKDKDLTTLIYNGRITVTGIPLEAYEYVVSGKPALDWVVERQCVKTDKDSGIVNDSNDWAVETMHNPKYPLELFLRVITVSLETMKIVKGMPKLDILEAEKA